mgnify:CR=1 FL=1
MIQNVHEQPARMPTTEEETSVTTIHAVSPPKLEGEVGVANAAHETALVAMEALLTTKIEAIDRCFNQSPDENQRMTYRKIQNGFRETRQAIGLIRSELRQIEKRQRVVDEQVRMLILTESGHEHV